MSETNAERVERLLDLPKGAVAHVAVRAHANGVEWSAFLKDGSWPQSRVSGTDFWTPPPFTHSTKRLVVGQKKVGEVKVGTEVVGKAADGSDITKDVMKDTFADVLEADDVVDARLMKEANAAAKAKGWRKVTLGAVTLTPEAASVSVACG